MELTRYPSSSLDSHWGQWFNTTLVSDTNAIQQPGSKSDAARIARETFVVNLFAVAALAWLLYDVFLNLGTEVSLVWNRWFALSIFSLLGSHLERVRSKRKGRHSRRIYVVVRYISVVNLALYVWAPTSTFGFLCKAWYYVVVVNTSVITLLPDVMMVIRVNAVYGWNLRTFILTTCLFLLQMTTSLAIGIVYVSSATATPSPEISIPGCSISAFNMHRNLTLAAWLPSITVQITYFALMVITLTQVMRGLDAKGKASIQSLGQVRRLVPTMVIYMRHGLCYYSFAIMTKAVNAIIVVNTTGPLQSIGIPWLVAIYPVLVSRIYLDMVKYLNALPKRSHLLEASGEGEDIRFQYASMDPSSTSPIGRGLGQITFATRASLSGTSVFASVEDFGTDGLV